MARKKNTTSKPPQKDRHKPKLVKLVDGTEVMERHGNDFNISKNKYQKKAPDSEKRPKDKKIEDEDAKMKYPPPKRNLVFRDKWKKFIKSLTDRENFIEAHLQTLEVLCDLYVEYEELERKIRIEGRTYETVSRWGTTRKMHPAISQMNNVRKEIRGYTTQLDLFPKKDKSAGGEGEEAEWG